MGVRNVDGMAVADDYRWPGRQQGEPIEKTRHPLVEIDDALTASPPDRVDVRPGRRVKRVQFAGEASLHVAEVLFSQVGVYCGFEADSASDHLCCLHSPGQVAAEQVTRLARGQLLGRSGRLSETGYGQRRIELASNPALLVEHALTVPHEIDPSSGIPVLVHITSIGYVWLDLTPVRLPVITIPPMRCVTVRVDGAVQGVGFRWWVQTSAQRLGLVGNVRNLRTGGVEMLLQGSTEKVDAMIALATTAGRGYRPGRVASFVVIPGECDPGLQGFEIVR